jgi:hypothetical protein
VPGGLDFGQAPTGSAQLVHELLVLASGGYDIRLSKFLPGIRFLGVYLGNLLAYKVGSSLRVQLWTLVVVGTVIE